jgi:hypothetical protein
MQGYKGINQKLNAEGRRNGGTEEFTLYIPALTFVLIVTL